MLPPLLAILSLLCHTLPVLATKFCQCEHPDKYEFRYPGIQHVCNDLSNDWCSTNCNSFGANCDYCQFKPAGQGPNADLAKLLSWCREQRRWDSKDETDVHGTDIMCYSYKNRVPKKFGYTGCDHEDNGDFARDAQVMLSREMRPPGRFQGNPFVIGCKNLMANEWLSLADDFISKYPTCEAINNGTVHRTIHCPYSKHATSKDISKQSAHFRSDCARYKGKFFVPIDWEDPPSIKEDRRLSGNDLQQPLGGVDGVPPRLSSPVEHHDSDSEAEVQWPSRKEEEVGVGGEQRVPGQHASGRDGDKEN
ncbi:MAG: hypothetical protein Q9197_006193 [Variospora fuerteventurae]